MVSSAQLGNKVKKFALVNPPESEIFQRSMKKELMTGETKFFSDDQLHDALDWIKS